MGLDVYAGPLTRYHLGAWISVVEQAAAELGAEFKVVRTRPEPADQITDEAVVLEAVLAWRASLGAQLGVEMSWPEGADLSYRTDRPGWEGWGAVQLLAAYSEHPDLRPRDRAWRRAKRDDPRAYPDSAAYRAVTSDPATTRYPALLLNTEWWLPADLGRGVVAAQSPHGPVLNMSGVDELLRELEDLNTSTLGMSEADVRSARQAGPGDASDPDAMAPFGLAVLLELSRFAARERTPLLLDY